MSKIKKIIIINSVLIIILFVLGELVSHYIFTKVCNWSSPLYKKTVSITEKNYDWYEQFFVNHINKSKSDKTGNIIIFGSSFAIGHGLKKEEGFAFLLHKLTGLNVYNRSFRSFGPQFMLFQIDNNLEKIIPSCSYIIYIYVDFDYRRIFTYREDPFMYVVCPKYVLTKDGSLKQKNISFFSLYSNIYKAYEWFYGDIHTKKQDGDELFYKIVGQSYLKSQKIYPDSKFIILNYSQKPLPAKVQLEKLGIKVLEISDLTSENMFSKQYQLSETEHDEHPNASAWKILTPAFIKKVGM